MAEKFFSAKILFSTAIPWAQKFILRVGEDIILPRRSEATRKAPSGRGLRREAVEETAADQIRTQFRGRTNFISLSGTGLLTFLCLKEK